MNTIHETAIIDEGAVIGENTVVWHFAHIRDSAVIGANCIIGQGVYIDTNVIIGDGCKIQNYACLYDRLVIEDGVFIGPHTCFTNDKYPKSSLWDDSMKKKTIVKQGASIGANSTILPGIIIGKESMIGAGSIVTTNVPAYTLVRGVAAKEFDSSYLRSRFL